MPDPAPAPNPYAETEAARPPEQIRLSPATAWALTALFLAVCTLPPLWRNTVSAVRGGTVTAWGAFRGKAPERTLREHLRAAEAEIEDAPFTVPPRRAIQRWLTAGMGEGNTKTVVGEDGWLFFRPAVQAVTGTGPLARSAFGPASDPSLKRWRPPLPAIRQFAPTSASAASSCSSSPSQSSRPSTPNT
jgi:hypothetical protein